MEFEPLAGQLLTNPSGREVVRALKRDWPPDRLISLLVSSDLRLVRAAVMSLGITGKMEHNRYLATMLRHEDDHVAEAAEHALWQVWMRSGSPWAVDSLSHACEEIDAGRYDLALELIDPIRMTEPTFAEAHHQGGLVCNLLDRYDEAEEAYRQTLRLNAYHFAAAQGLARMHLERGQLSEAREHYRFAVNVNPRLNEVRDILDVIDALLGQRGELQ